MAALANFSFFPLDHPIVKKPRYHGDLDLCALTSGSQGSDYEGKKQLIWTFDNYQRFLRHPAPIGHGWVVDRIELQHLQQTGESFPGLSTDPDSHLQITATRAICEHGKTRCKPVPLVAFPQSEGFVTDWFLMTWDKLRSLPPASVYGWVGGRPSPLLRGSQCLPWEALSYCLDQPARLAL